MTVNRRRFAVLACALVAVNVFFWLATAGFALPGGGGILQTLLGGRLIRAEILWQAPDGSIQDTELYRGVIVAVTPAGITLREKDRTEVIPVSPTASVRYGAQTASSSVLRRGMRVLIAAPANSPADTIQVEGQGGG